MTRATAAEEKAAEMLQAGEGEVPLVFVDKGKEVARIDADELGQLEQSTELVVQRAQALEISSDASYQAAGEFLTGELKPMLKEITDTFGPIISATNKAHKAALAEKRRHEAPLLEAERIIKGGMGVYHQQQQEIARQAEAERLAAAKAEAEERALAEAAELEERGEKEAAEDVIRQPVTPVVTKPAPAPAQAAGTSVRMVRRFRIINRSAIDPRFLMPDETKIGQIVRSMGADAATIVGGIEVYEEPVVSARAR